ncbi:hypothetical protein CW705_01760 [Candidatus Bathyarchaeota archaeon]|nr:MAG: hypothetical protein CW705_01760 [Candidatus Bathyarchaeota archaeon]
MARLGNIRDTIQAQNGMGSLRFKRYSFTIYFRKELKIHNRFIRGNESLMQTFLFRRFPINKRTLT